MKKYVIYEGAFGIRPDTDHIIAYGTGDWYPVVDKLYGPLDPFYRSMTIDDFTYIDFGNWSRFVMIY